MWIKEQVTALHNWKKGPMLKGHRWAYSSGLNINLQNDIANEAMDRTWRDMDKKGRQDHALTKI